ncbi:sigma-70 family RNA polymerase sigma factor [uncultured Pontibacter sp.]|uniref:RNA polymerase sigma factor n=1 Tax=uncultured Pontibacter sp. TaxID=453356 RepID=UPI00262092D9|nr:sigma-70 family RNA polymerase sigma factor [uncultured Pontibacter sp.]
MKEEFLDLIKQHQGIIHKICKLYRDSLENRQDLFQEIVYQLWKSYPKFRQESGVTTWMYRISLNTALASFRKQTTPIKYTDSVPDLVEEQSSSNDGYEQLLIALKQLNEGERAVISLYLEDLSYKEISEIVGISESNVGVRLNRIKNKLKQLVKEHSYGS